MLQEKYPYYLANKPVYANEKLEVFDKYSGELATKVAMADAETIDKAIGHAAAAPEACAAMAPYERKALLEHCVS
ncbi:MAG: aldehyde dehydrogenase family protein, partial [Pseudomonadales bacterium]|nr:aldehyde dehydrogenase family protein [Pseudomonadales bacterium]